MSHQHAVEANIRVFDQEFADNYDKRDSVQVITVASTRILLEFDTSNPTARKSPEETSRAIEPSKDPETLADVATFATKFPHSAFKPGIKLMDFACGTGIVTEKLYPYLAGDKDTSIVGVDINEILLNSFDLKAKAAPANVHVESHVCDVLTTEPEVQAKFESSFDVVICTMSYHHLENYRDITTTLATFLKKGGWLFIIDFYNEDVETEEPQAADEHSAVRHMGGLKISALNETLHESGLSNVSSAREVVVPIWQPRKFGETHSSKKALDDLNSGKLPSRDGTTEKEYLIDTSLILSCGIKS